jgi:DNA polymerase-3 subunit delta'
MAGEVTLWSATLAYQKTDVSHIVCIMGLENLQKYVIIVKSTTKIGESAVSYEQLLGNERLKENLNYTAKTGKFSHFYVISGPEGSGKRTLAKLLASALVCKGEEKPCGICAHCQKASRDNHPDIIYVDDPERKTVPIDLLRKVREELFILPNEAERKVYIIPRGQDLAGPGQNSLLKILEEPPAYGVFIILTTNPEILLPTVRSRCTELAMRPLPAEILQAEFRKAYPNCHPDIHKEAIARCGGWLGRGLAFLQENGKQSPQTEAFVKALSEHNHMGVVEILVPMQKWKRDAVISELEKWAEVVHTAIGYRHQFTVTREDAKQLGNALSTDQLIVVARTLRTAIEYANENVAVTTICGYLEWMLRL